MPERKIILTGAEARAGLLAGVKKLSETVCITMGPLGQNVVITKNWFTPHVTKDGVTVAKEVVLHDQVENAGAQIVKQASQAAMDNAGDGTTTATLLAYELAKGADTYIRSRPHTNTKRLVDGIRAAQKTVHEYLMSKAIPCNTQADILAIALISANGDQETADLITSAFEKVGANGIVIVTDSKSSLTNVTVSEGFTIDRGYYNPAFINNRERGIAELESPLVLLTDLEINHVNLIVPYLEQAAKSNRAILIMAKDFAPEVVAVVAQNNARGTIKSSLIRSPGFGDDQIELLEDIALFTGSTVIGGRNGTNFEAELKTATWANALGDKVGKVRSNKDRTTFIGSKVDRSEIDERAAFLRSRADQEDDAYRKEKLEERLAKIAGAIALISVGGHTEVEQKELKDRVDDAVHAVRAAIAHGYLPGGGVALYNARSCLDMELDSTPSDFEEGWDIVRYALGAPIKKLFESASIDFTNVTLSNKMLELGYTGDKQFGMNTATGVYGNMISMGIIDPVKVTTSALEAAVSAAVAIITTGAVIIEDTSAIPMTNMGMPAYPGQKY